MRKRGNGLRTSTSSTTPKRGGRSVDSDSATTRSPVLRSMSYLHARFKPERTPAASIAPDLYRACRVKRIDRSLRRPLEPSPAFSGEYSQARNARAATRSGPGLAVVDVLARLHIAGKPLRCAP